jgi:hypothetical protein
MSVDIRQVPISGKLRDFLDVVDTIYRDDPNYVRPLDMMVKDQLGRKNPFFEHAEGTVFTAHRDGRCVGRCTAQIDRGHLSRYQDDVGFFGFFDTIDDAEVARALIASAKTWLSDRGMKQIRGPLSLSTNEELGCLVEGFDTKPMFLMPHHRPYQGGLIEAAGLSKSKDLFAWRYETGSVPPRVRKAFDAVTAMPEVVTRPVDLKNVQGDIRVVMDVYNDAWSDNWGYVPLTEAELTKMASDMKLLLDPAITAITFIDGEPAAVALALPNLNELIGDFGGHTIRNLPKLIYRLKFKRPTSARMIILGIRKKFRVQRKYAGLSLYLYARMNEAGRERGYRWGELSWTLEDNGPVNTGIKVMGGKVYKRYRIYEGDL